MIKFIKKLFILIFDLLLVCIISLIVVAAISADSVEEFFEYRKNNVVEYILNREDGVSHFDMCKSTYAAFITILDSKIIYTNEPMLEDAYRHYTWSFETSKLIGEEKTKLITDNHEMALTTRVMAEEQFETLYNEYRSEGLIKIKAAWRALDETFDMIPDLRSSFVNDSRNASESEIRNFYSSASIMDLYNNEAGRIDGCNCAELERAEAFNNELSSNNIVTSYDNLDSVYNAYMLDYVRNKINY